MKSALDHVSYEKIEYRVRRFMATLAHDLDQFNLLAGRELQVDHFVEQIARQLVYRVIDAHYEREIKDHSIQWPQGWWDAWKVEHPTFTALFLRPPSFCRVTFRIFDVLKDIPVSSHTHRLAIMQEIDYFKTMFPEEWEAR